MTTGESTHERGMKVRREVLGDEHVDAAIERTTDFGTGGGGSYQSALRRIRFLGNQVHRTT
jgi:hypothetical protein